MVKVLEKSDQEGKPGQGGMGPEHAQSWPTRGPMARGAVMERGRSGRSIVRGLEQLLGVPAQVVFHGAGDEVVAVVQTSVGAPEMVSSHGLKPCPAPQSPVVPPADVCPLQRGRQRVPVCGSDRKLRGAGITIANVASGSMAVRDRLG